MADKPILFSAPMVRAILEGRKTMTRRAIKGVRNDNCLVIKKATKTRMGIVRHVLEHRPYEIGDRLWVRENGWQRPERSERDMRDGADTWPPYMYDADDDAPEKEWGWKRRPSIHMPRWASRITLEVMEVKVERLQDISETDCLCEGVTRLDGNGTNKFSVHIEGGWFSQPTAAATFRGLWEDINGDGAWEANPWVAAISFKRVK
ncbi:MAG: hypothetical protein KGO94_14090 [Alphaproteobacteria bacterium]|nr:hypothetical protein [Alphaproteobacteria bacterium]